MYGVPKDLNLDVLIGQDFNFIGLGRHQIQFHISGLVAIHVEGDWELLGRSGEILDRHCETPEREAYRLHYIIGVPISRWAIDPPRSVDLFFASGYRLRIYDNSIGEYESFSVHFKGRPSMYF